MDELMFPMYIVSYVLFALGMQSIAKRRGIQKPWLAWIPVANMWLLGCISDQYQYVQKAQEKNKRKWMLWLTILSVVICIGLAVALLMVTFEIVRELGLMDMTESQLQALVASGSGALQQEITELIYSKLDNDAEFFTSFMRLSLGLTGGSILLSVLGIWLLVLYFKALYDLYKSTCPEFAVGYLLLSIFLSPIAVGVLVFLCRNKDDGMPPRQVVVEQATWVPPADTYM